MKTNILSNMISILNSFAKRIMMIVAVVMMAGSAWAAAGDEITSHTNIVSGKWYYIKGVRTNGTTIEYLTFNDNLGTVNGTSSSTTNGAIPLKFTYESSNWYITTPKGYYVTTTTSNGKLTLTSTPTTVTLGTSSSKITIQGDSYYLQKNGGASNFGSYSGAQQHVTLIEAQTYTVNWSVNGGSCSGSPSTEGQADHKIAVLPTTPVSCDASKVFVGWTNTPISGSTNTRPSVLFTHANGAPTITGDVTYYAVFAIKSNASTLLSEDFSSIVNGNSTSTSGSGNSWPTLTDNFTSSSYVYQAGGAVRLGTGTTGYLVTKELTAAVGSVLTISFGVKGWTNVEGDIGVTADDDEFADPGSISYTSTMSGSFETQEVSVVLTKANPKIKISALSSRAFIDDLVITKATYSEYVTTCCDKLVELSAGTETNATISSFSPSSVPTCSETAANRNVTITVAAATGYEFTSSARLGYSGDGTATYQSGPTGSGPYTFVYQFAKNDNGDGSFSVTSATPKTYTITYLDQGGGAFTGTQAGAPTTHTYGTATTLKIPTKFGNNFGGWYTAPDCASGAVGDASSASLAADGYTADITLYAKWTEKAVTNYRTSCCDYKVTFTQNDPENGTIAFSHSSLTTCGATDGERQRTMTITPDPGYKLKTFEVATGDGKVAASSTSPDVAVDEDNSDAQVITLTFAQNAEGNYDVTATFEEMHDEYYDYMHANAKQGANRTGVYNAPSLSSKTATTGADCKENHYKFKGWVVSDEVNEDGTLKSGYTLITSGSSMTASNKIYYAVWAEEE